MNASRHDARPFPCLDDGRYDGCLGLACPLQVCWTGAATVRVARIPREQSPISTLFYVPGAPCHGCACLREDDAPVASPRTPGRPAQARRITCARGLWAHPISLASFVTGRIPMCDEDEPESCPGFEPRSQPHPAVVAHLARRRERKRHAAAERGRDESE